MDEQMIIPDIDEAVSYDLKEDISSEISEPIESDTAQDIQEAELPQEDDVEALREEISLLRRSLEEKNMAYERMSREIGEFSELFPDKNVSSLPDSVWESVRNGVPLAAAYALYEKRITARAAEAERVNARNSDSSTGPIGKNSDESFFTPDEVRAMSRSEVRQNYSKILESMQKWN